MKTKQPKITDETVKAIHDLYLEKKSRNSSYSGRALARDLGLSSPFLSQIMTGKRNLSLQQKLKLADTLGIKIKLPATEKHSPKQIALKNAALWNAAEHEKILKYWYHFAILELSQTKFNSAHPKQIAKRLNLSELETRSALARLVDFGYLTITRDQKMKRTKLLYIVDPKKSSQSIRNYHQTRLMSATNELNTFTEERIQNRNFQTLFVATSQDKIEKAKVRIKEFTDSLMEELSSDEPEEIFQFSSQLFSIENKPSPNGS